MSRPDSPPRSGLPDMGSLGSDPGNSPARPRGREDTVSILAGGWSVRGEGVDLAALPGFVIGVNDAGLLADCDALVSMDRLWAEHRIGRIVKRARATILRRSAVQNIRPLPSWVRTFEGDNRSAVFAGEHGRLNGGNSGYCAFNLAWQMRPRRILLYGFDMGPGPKGEPYWYAPYPWTRPQGATSRGRFAEWRAQFAEAARQCREASIEVIVVGLRSAITEFPKIAPAAVRELPRP